MANSFRVLVVDDEEIDRTTIARILCKHGYAVLEAQGCRDAMAAWDLNRNAIDLLVTDISLPDGNGCALAIAIQERKPQLRLLLVSGHVGAEVCKFYGLEVTDLHFLRKPFDEVQLLTSVQSVLSASDPFPRVHL
jgi:two-component system, cell cycle sensor histidine kinase and response regulator CckA